MGDERGEDAPHPQPSPKEKMCANIKKPIRIDPVDAFVAYLQGVNMRVTSERVAIAKVIAKHSGLFNIDELHRRMDQESLPVATATLYNTIELMLDAGLLRSLRLPDREYTLYRMVTTDSSLVVVVCDMCGAVKEVTGKMLTRYINNYEFASFAPRTFTLTVNGLCRKCRKLIDKNMKGK